MARSGKASSGKRRGAGLQNLEWSEWHVLSNGWNMTGQAASFAESPHHSDGRAVGRPHRGAWRRKALPDSHDGPCVSELSDQAAATAEYLLDALAPDVARHPHNTQAGGDVPTKSGKKTTPMAADLGHPLETFVCPTSADQLLGHWVDSQGNSVHVMCIDAWDAKLVATLSRSPRPDITLAIKPIMMGGGWQCGHSLLDPLWTTEEQMHWVAVDGRVSVWVRPQDEAGIQVPESAQVIGLAIHERCDDIVISGGPLERKKRDGDYRADDLDSDIARDCTS
mmetsp:Transcript_11228/g.32041  ORF Transcript_11228/g.32041 Transcript_11228/m.32041 type:complete len:280 (+) Transcript_11228:43-882(+)|eukprot:CAMPEP_0170232574 /NCGR_PEP_ID=MMETSP0116_2-20130129/16028_1 /TAXON_ID=400756 /ORGANISM="Durinskia baltica, Strain CSIRO CS-38" /LENGTH=279 /DNA_ID=CAMNT_0010483359 /DNA_START=40 /DNA_END=879 /DNA_ORIENTATION=-